ncbi:hypothetical protein [Alkalicoccobacillus plakortidis]|uniref:Uncharacterized protein n=1 Tax=Alkalicoccobacillus plakortidis TaxID=444060 RepID=A0ABT0XNN1_9BACI|nr:hypothetical protein [Alkalicoccobacillus plakortidis]MCM2676857.1 hypothetical protein [Alkalicoccobacillus plakortidis]
MTKQKVGRASGIVSLICIAVSVIYFFFSRGPEADVYLMIAVGGISSIAGLILAIVSAFLMKRYVYLIVGLLGNGTILVFSFFLLLAMGISEP